MSETDDQKTDEAQASGAEGVEEETDDPEVTPEATPQPTVTPEAAEKPQAASATAVKAAESNGQAAPTSAAQENANSTEGQQTTTTSEADQHTHQWVQQTETVHHEASGHYETKIVQEAYEEPVYEYHVFCDTCGADVNTSALEHKAIHDNGFTSKKIQTGSIHHDAVTQEVWVEEPAYDEVVTRGYVCSVCGAGE